MIKLMFLIKRKPGTTIEHFRQHYETSHVRIAEKYFRDIIENYRRNYPISNTLNPVDNAEHGPNGQGEAYDAITEMWLKDQSCLDEMLRRFASEELQGIIAADEEMFMDRSSINMIVCDEVISW